MKKERTDDVPKGIWGNTGTDVYTVGDSGRVSHYDGSAWTDMESGTTKNLNAAWSVSGTDVFAVGDMGTILHLSQDNGSPSVTEPSPTEQNDTDSDSDGGLCFVGAAWVDDF